MTAPALNANPIAIVPGEPYALSTLFSYVSGTGPDGEGVVSARVSFFATPDVSFPGSPEITAGGFYSFLILGDATPWGDTLSGDFSSASIVFNSATSVSGSFQYEYVPPGLPQGFIQAVAEDYTFPAALPCFAADTRIRTARGDVAVEDMRVGDEVPVLVGGGVSRVVWIGQRRVECGRHPEPRKVWPVRVRAGAFGPGWPVRDLYLSPDHALYVEEVLIPVRYLVDGEAIAQVPVACVTYYHIELERHDVVLAEGLPAESFLDTGAKQMFENGSGQMVLYPDFAIRLWEAEGCAPLVVSGPEVVAARRRVNKGPRVA